MMILSHRAAARVRRKDAPRLVGPLATCTPEPRQQELREPGARGAAVACPIAEQWGERLTAA